MLHDLLGHVATGGVHSYEDLSDKLSISTPLLEAMLADLSRLGYLRPVGNSCQGVCGKCPVGGCSITGPRQLWTLTEKGVRAATQS
jgi:hypothetical protein